MLGPPPLVAPPADGGPFWLALGEAAAWMTRAACRGKTTLFFPSANERPEARQRREAAARRMCSHCPVFDPCRLWARQHQEYGFWGGESEDERARAVDLAPVPDKPIRRRRAGPGPFVRSQRQRR